MTDLILRQSRAVAAEEFLRGIPITPDHAAQAAELALAGAKPLSRNAYKITIARALVTRALLGRDCAGMSEVLSDVTRAYDPTELSTFHRCSSRDAGTDTP